MGETDTHGETHEGGAPSPLTHSGRLPLKSRVPVDGETCLGPRSLAGPKVIVEDECSRAAGRGAELGEIQAVGRGSASQAQHPSVSAMSMGLG